MWIGHYRLSVYEIGSYPYLRDIVNDGHTGLDAHCCMQNFFEKIFLKFIILNAEETYRH